MSSRTPGLVGRQPCDQCSAASILGGGDTVCQALWEFLTQPVPGIDTCRVKKLFADVNICFGCCYCVPGYDARHCQCRNKHTDTAPDFRKLAVSSGTLIRTLSLWSAVPGARGARLDKGTGALVSS